MDIALRNERRNLEELQQRRVELENEIRLERNLTIDEPKVLGTAIVKPHVPVAIDEGESLAEDAIPFEDEELMSSNTEIESIGMRVAIEYEESQGWQVEDVSAEKHGGFDIRSLMINEDGRLTGVRYIEVKARATTGAIRLTANEWKKARHFGEDYWLYIVTNAASNPPHLTIIHNPASMFTEEENIFATGFIIKEEHWRKHTQDRL